MEWYQWLSYGAFFLCLLICAGNFIRLVRLGKPTDFAAPAGSEKSGIAYSFTSGMSPKKKESAFLHLPTYLAGMVFHLGTFLSILIYLVLLVYSPPPGTFLTMIPAALLSVGALCGAGILIKRMVTPLLRKLSNPDDYISNFLVTLSQAALALALVRPSAGILFWITTTVLWLWFPFGKLKHAMYFFAARYHLGLFFGRRGVWPSPKQM